MQMQHEQPYNEQKATGYRPQERAERKQMGINYRALGELVRGLFFILFGLYACFAQRLGIGQFAISQNILNILGGILMAYGLFRVYRGVKNTFFKQD
jgi:hypothetical protein